MCLFTNAVFVLHPGQILPRSGCNGTPAQRLGLIDDISTLCRLQRFIYYSIDFIIINSQIKQPECVDTQTGKNVLILNKQFVNVEKI